MGHEVDNWTRAFEPGYDVEDPHERKRVDLSVKQKNWLTRAWMWASVAVLGMKEECIPNAVPQYNESQGWHYQPIRGRNWHHVKPVGNANRILEEPYNKPDNIVPVN